MSNLSYRSGILVSTGCAFLGRALAIISGIVLAKVLEPKVFGRFFTDQALVLIGGGLINLGIGQGYRLLTSRNPELRESYLFPAIILRLAAMLLYFAGLTVYLKHTDRWSMQTTLVVLATLLLNLLELLQTDLYIIRDYTKASLLDFGSGLVVFLAAIICMLAGARYDFLVSSYLLFAFLIIVVGWLCARPAWTSTLISSCRTLLRTSIPFAVSLVAYTVTSFWGLTYIGEVLGEEQAGFYAVPLKVYQISLVVGMSVTAVTLPLYHKLAASGQFELYARIFGRLVCGLWLISGVIVAMCYFIPEFIIIAFANEQYMPAAAIFPWIGFGILLRLLAIPAGNILESVDKQWYRVGIQVIGAIICVLAVSFVVPRWGIVGAAWTLFATDLWTLMAYWFTSRHFATAVVSLRDLLIPCSVLVALLLVLSHCPVVVCLRVLLFCGLWIAYVIAFLNGKEEIRSILAAIASRGQ